MNFTGKVAIVTGGAQGIGKAITKALLNNGMKVFLCDINESNVKSFMEEISDAFTDKVIYKNCDVSCFQDFKAAFNEAKSAFGKIDVLINNAGIINEIQWKRMIDVNFIGVINGIHLAFEFMGTDNGGSGGCIINTASNLSFDGFSLLPIYSGSKHAVLGLTKSYGSQYHLDKTGVSVKAICPGPIDTPLFHSFAKDSLDKELAEKHNYQTKTISPDEVAKAVLHLLQDGRNGALLRVDSDGMRYANE